MSWLISSLTQLIPLSIKYSSGYLLYSSIPFHNNEDHLWFVCSTWGQFYITTGDFFTNIVSPKTENWHDGKFVITGMTAGCDYDNLWYHQWWQSWHLDDSWFSVLSEILVSISTHHNFLHHCIMRIALRMLMSSNFNLCSIISSMMARINRTVRNVSWC